MPIALIVLKVLLAAATAVAVFVLATNWPSRLDLRVAMRYLRSRRSSRLLSLITVIAVGGVTIGVMALVIVLGVMNGMQNDLREKILVVNPHLRVLTYGKDSGSTIGRPCSPKCVARPGSWPPRRS